METTQTIIVSELPIGERHQVIFDAFEVLPLNNSFQIVVDHEPRGLLNQFREFRTGQSEWSLIKQENRLLWYQIKRISNAPNNQEALELEQLSCKCGGNHKHD